MTILALDTAGQTGSLALNRQGELIATRSIESTTGFAQILFQELRVFLDLAHVRLSEIDCFASANGPGSFTGVRVSLAAVKGLAAAEGKPAIAISNLRALSFFGTTHHRAVLLDARRNEVYAAVYDQNLSIVVPETVLPFDAWLASLPVPIDEVISFRNLILPSPLPAPHVFAPETLASAIAACAEIDCHAGRCGDPSLLDANYVRPPDAQPMKL